MLYSDCLANGGPLVDLMMATYGLFTLFYMGGGTELAPDGVVDGPSPSPLHGNLVSWPLELDGVD